MNNTELLSKKYMQQIQAFMHVFSKAPLTAGQTKLDQARCSFWT